jgi:hypothetical protein
MKKPRVARRRLREMKYEKKLAENMNFKDVQKAATDHANLLAKRKEKKEKGK